MTRAGAATASLLHRLRTGRRLPLLVLFALVVQAIAPALVSASARAGGLASVICTAEGVRHVMVVEGGVPAPDAPRHADCPYCGAHWQPALPGPSGALRVADVSINEAVSPAPILPAQTRRLVAAHRTRAPPAAH